MNGGLVLVLDFGGQYNQLIARKIRELNVYSELLPYNTPIAKIKSRNPIGIVLTGDPSHVDGLRLAGGLSAFGKPSLLLPSVDPGIFELGIPVLGISYGMQFIAYKYGGVLCNGAMHDSAPQGGALQGNALTENVGEYCKADIHFSKSVLFESVESVESVEPVESAKPANSTDSTVISCWMSHSTYVESLPPEFTITAHTKSNTIAAFEHPEKKLYALQFHPEVHHTAQGMKILKNFLYKVCKASGEWTMDNFVTSEVARLRQKIGDKKVLCALSGGVDSSVVASLVHKAIGENLICIFVDTGLMRQNEADEVEALFKRQYGANFIRVDAKDRFFDKLKGISNPETKRKIIGEEFIRVFEEQAKKIGFVDFFVQGTIYADVVESGGDASAVIKSHHNVGGLPDVIAFKEIIEPLRSLFKDEVRKLGLSLSMPEDIVYRQPFPGPGLAIRCIGEVTEERIEIIRATDAIYREEISRAKLAREVWQYFTVLTDTRSVGVVEDQRTYGYTVALRGVTSVDAMTADWARIPYDVLAVVSTRIINEVRGISRVVYDITGKPPATIEWE